MAGDTSLLAPNSGFCTCAYMFVCGDSPAENHTPQGVGISAPAQPQGLHSVGLGARAFELHLLVGSRKRVLGTSFALACWRGAGHSPWGRGDFPCPLTPALEGLTC